MAHIQLLYVSSATVRISDAMVEEILAVSRRNNAGASVTGMLLTCGDNFFQVLEGGEAAVDETFARIGRDRRHRRVDVLLRLPAEQRMFAEWSMGFENLSAPREALPDGAFEISRAALDGRLTVGDAGHIRRFMENFYRINTRRALAPQP
ncbi:MAG: BLUF domain-containing protein [Rhodospirillales bacterium]